MKNGFYILLSLLLIFPHTFISETIIFAWHIHRHGARSPLSGIRNHADIYKEPWLEKQELTNVGKRMLYLLGVNVRKRYIEKYKLLSETYSPQEILIRSTDVNRTIESVESLLQGLYPHGSGPSINKNVAENKNISYPPNKLYNDKFEDLIEQYELNKENNYYALPFKMNILPIHLFYRPAHEFELYSTDICPGHTEIYKAQEKREEIKAFGEKLTSTFPNVFETLEGTTNKTILYGYSALYKYADTYIADDRDKRELKILKEQFHFNESDFKTLEKYSKEYLDMDYFDTNYPKDHPEISTMAFSYTFHSIINWMENAKKGKESNNKNYIKYVIYSAHDSSIGALENFMENNFNTKAEYSEFAESRFFELYKDDNGVYKVRYLKGDSLEPKVDMEFNEFKKKINADTWSDEKVGEYCHFIKESKKETSIFFIVMICLAGVNAVFLIILIILFAKKNKYKKVVEKA